MAAIPGIDFGVLLNNTVSPAALVLTDTGTYPAETRATAAYNAAGLTALALGTLITISVEETPGNYVTVTTYTTQAGDDNATTLAGRIATAIDGEDGYGATANTGTLTVTARPGLGAGVNTGDLFFSWTGGSASTTFSGGVNGLVQVGGEADITGWFRVTQPDGIVTNIGSFDSPVIENNAGTITQSSSTLRLAVDGSFQNGTYSITYYLRAEGYDDTMLTKQFTLSYTKPKAIPSTTTDVFTPAIVVTDTTTYTQAGLTLQSTIRAWDGDVDGVGTVSAGNVSQFDMAISGDYHFAKYEATLTSTITYQVTAASYVTLLDEIEGTVETTALKPLTLQEILDLIEALFLQGWSGCYDCSDNTVKWNLLVNLFYVYQTQGGNGNLNAVFEIYEKMLVLIDELDTTDLYTAATPNGDVLTAYSWTL